ncbi:MAG: S8 family serine peptidase [Pseudomonadales bacterium]|nr:S8 family serine peptidase [Pseudomonadales bacterium]
MQRLRALQTGFLGLSLALTAPLANSKADSYAPSSSAPQYPHTNRIIVKYKDQSPTLLPQVRSALRASVLYHAQQQSGKRLVSLRSLRSGAQVVRLENSDSMTDIYAAIDQIVADPAVEYAEPDLLMLPKAVPNDPRYGEQWHYYEANGGLNLPNAWDYSEGEGSVVAVLDTGYRDHEDLSANLLPGYDFVSDLSMANDGDGRDADALDPGDAATAGECGNGVPEDNTASSWHGTHVAGTIAAVANNGIGISGVAPKAKVIPVRVLGKCGGYVSDISDAILWSSGYTVDGVADNANPADIINLSLGSGIAASCTQTYSDAILAAREAGVTVVVAAGNEDANADLYPPANCAGVIAVAAVGRAGGKAYYSNYGSVVDVAAPGGAQYSNNDPDGVLSTSNSGYSGPGSDNYLFYQGTSMATPHIAGLAALLYSVDEDITPDTVENIIKSTARSFNSSCNGCGVGIADAAAAVAVVSGIEDLGDATNLALKFEGKTGKYQKIDNTLGLIRYQATITNLGELDTTNVQLTSQYVDEVSFISATPSQGDCSGDGLSCDLGDLLVGEAATVTFVYHVPSSYSGTKFIFTGAVSSDLIDSVSSNNFVLKKYGGALAEILAGLLVLACFRRRYPCWR